MNKSIWHGSGAGFYINHSTITNTQYSMSTSGINNSNTTDAILWGIEAVMKYRGVSNK